MNIFIADETNNQASDQVKFFLYGGIIANTNNIQQIVGSVRQLRIEYDVADNEKLKFNIHAQAI